MYLTYSFDKPTREKFSIVSADGLSTTVNTAVGKYQYTMFIERIWMQQNCRQIFVLSLAESNYISDTRNCRDVSHQRFCRIKRPRKTDIYPHVFHSDISYKNVGMVSCIPILYFIYECMCNCWKKSCYYYHVYYFFSIYRERTTRSHEIWRLIDKSCILWYACIFIRIVVGLILSTLFMSHPNIIVQHFIAP